MPSTHIKQGIEACVYKCNIGAVYVHAHACKWTRRACWAVSLAETVCFGLGGNDGGRQPTSPCVCAWVAPPMGSAAYVKGGRGKD